MFSICISRLKYRGHIRSCLPQWLGHGYLFKSLAYSKHVLWLRNLKLQLHSFYESLILPGRTAMRAST
jgi:hypothetical protein